jgi:hypothetical protein
MKSGREKEKNAKEGKYLQKIKNKRVKYRPQKGIRV